MIILSGGSDYRQGFKLKRFRGPTRAILMVAVGNELCAVDIDGRYRPHITPANRHIPTLAVDAGGILQGSYCMYLSPALGRRREHGRAERPSEFWLRFSKGSLRPTVQ